MSRLIVTLGAPDGRTRELAYDVRETAGARLWAESLTRARPRGLRETNRFYNFPRRPESGGAPLLARLRDIVDRLRVLHPELPLPPLDERNLQNDLNVLHFRFVHNADRLGTLSEQHRNLWAETNNLLHAIEGAMNDDALKARAGGLRQAHAIFTWESPEHVPIPDGVYREFTIGLDFGMAYVNYSQVGRHFYEMFLAQDDQLPDDQIRPLPNVSADTLLWFGPTTGHYGIELQMNLMRDWFAKRADRFGRLGYAWGDPRLALGLIPVAALRERASAPDEVRRFVDELAPFDAVVDARLA